jgi:caffeoyl-CoA O-methyltransferase
MRCGMLLICLAGAVLLALSGAQSVGSGSCGYRAADSVSIAGTAVALPLRGESSQSPDSIHTLESVIERYIDALGGRAAIERVETRRCRGRLVTDLPSNDPPVHETLEMEVYSALPNKWLLVGRDSSGILKNGFDGETGWDQNLDTVKPEPRMERAKLAFLVTPHGPLHIGDYFHEMSLEGTVELDGRICYAVTSDRKESHYTLYFDTETGLLSQIGYYWYLREYREVDGVMFPFEIEVSRKGGSTTYYFEEVEQNIPIDGELFSMPDVSDIFPGTFGGIGDERILPMLQHLPYRHGGMNIPSADGRFLYDMIIERGYRRGLEIGTSNGYSTLWLGLAFRETGGSVVTLEIEPESAEEARENFARAGLDSVIDPRICDAIEEIPKLDGEFDFVFIDAWKPDYISYFKLLKDRIIPGGAITAHNVVSQDNHMRDFLAAIETDPDFETTIHRTSTEGISVSIKRR